MEAQGIRVMLRIAFCILCIYQAHRKNRSLLGWGIFGFVLPLVANIWIACLKVHQDWEENPEIDSKQRETPERGDAADQAIGYTQDISSVPEQPISEEPTSSNAATIATIVIIIAGIIVITIIKTSGS